MGGIVGHVGADPHRPTGAADGLLTAMRGAPFGRLNQWTSGSVLLAHLETGTTGSTEDNLAAPAAPLRIAADIRLDNRAELAAALGADAAQKSDADLVVLAYSKWGVRCADHLTGDFAFAIWDASAHQLFCARDQMGVKPFYYRQDRDGLAVATQLASLSRPADTLDAGRIATFLAGIDDSFDDTAFTEIHRLPPAHWLLWTREGTRISRYWTLAHDTLPANEDFAAGFRDRLLRAVNDRLRGKSEIGALLSGGLDSSSIVSAAAFSHRDDPKFSLRTFSFSYPNSPRFDERPYGDTVLADYGLQGEYVEMDDLAPLDGLAGLVEAHDDVFFAPGAPKISKLLASARKSGVRVILDGHGGDEVASHGFGRLAELARDRQWVSLYRELRGVSSIYGVSPLAMFGKYYFAQGLGLKVRRRLQRARRQPVVVQDPAASLIHPHFASVSNLADRSNAWHAARRRAGMDETSLHVWNVSSPGVSRSFETLARVATQMGIEQRFPFYDRRLVSYALAMPEGEKLRDGWTRSVLRRAMVDILPEKVRWRRTKINFGPELSEGLARHHHELFESILHDGSPVGDYIDLQAARATAGRLLADPATVPAGDVFMLWRIAFLGLWLESRSATSVREEVLS